MARWLPLLMLALSLVACDSESLDSAMDAVSDSPVTSSDVLDTADVVAGVYTISVDVTFPADAVSAGFRPVAAVYLKAAYSDFTVHPTGIPTGALLGADASGTLQGPIMDFGQTHAYEFAYGDYSLVIGIADTNGMPKPVEGKLFVARAIRTDAPDTVVVIAADDPDWATY